MSRSVSTHRHAIATVYLRPEIENHDNPYAWSDFLDDLRNILTGEAGVDSKLLLNGHPFTGFQGYKPVDRWAGREDHVILEGELSEVSVSEYGGMVAAVCLAPLDPDDEHHVTACRNAAPYFTAILRAAYPDCCYAKFGTFSNGESVYTTLDA